MRARRRVGEKPAAVKIRSGRAAAVRSAIAPVKQYPTTPILVLLTESCTAR
jgi:hypothetical protein